VTQATVPTWRWRYAVIVLAVLSFAMWPIVTARFHPNPARVPMWLWGTIAWSWPMLALALASGRINRWLESALVLVVVPFAVCMMGIALVIGLNRGLRPLEPMRFDGRPIRLAKEHWEGYWSSCEETTALVTGGWLVQRLGFITCSGSGPFVVFASDSFQVRPGPTADTFVLSANASSERSGPTRVTLGAYRIGLGGQLVRVAGGDDDRR